MALQVGVNSWVTQAEANEYLELKKGADDWGGLSSNTKDQDLVTAFRWIFNSNKFNIAKSNTSDVVKSAQIELAWYIEREYECHQDREALQSQGVSDFKLKDWSEKFSKTADIPQYILDILDDFISGIGAEGFNVTRPLSPNSGTGGY